MDEPKRERSGLTAIGYTLIDVIIALAIVAVLAAIAYPSYRESVDKARRSEAAGALLEAAQALERYHTVNGRYVKADGNLPAVFSDRIPANGAVHYNIAAAGTPTANSFILRATRAGVMSGDACGDLQIDQAGVVSLHDADAGKTVAQCWRR